MSNKDLELEGMLVGHFVGSIPRGSDKPVSYIMQGNGLWEIRRNVLGTFRKHIAKARIPGLSCDLEEGFDLSVPKIPLPLLWQIVSFFRQVYKLHHSEAIVRVVYDRKEKRYFLDCPPQVVSAAHCNFDRTRMPVCGVVVAEIHSHGQLQAEFSGTDNRDELADRFYGIVGQVSDFFPQTNFRVSIGGRRLSVELQDLFDVERDSMFGAKFPLCWLDQVKERPPLRKFEIPKRFLEDRNLLLPEWDLLDEENGLSEMFPDEPEEMEDEEWQGRNRRRR